MKYKFRNNILEGLIGRYVNLDKNLTIQGFTYAKGIGTTILTYLVKSAFNIHRFPLWEDRHFTKELHTCMNGHDKLKQVFENDIFLEYHDDIIEEIKEIYSYTQSFLNEEYKDQNYVKLYRNLEGEYAAILLQLKNQAIIENKTTIKISTDILNSFTDNPGTYGKDVHIEIDVPKQDVLYYANIFDYGVMESEEFVILNNSKDGLIEIPVERIFKSYNDYDETRWRLHECKDQKYYYCNFSINTQINFGKHYKKRNYEKENFICNYLKKIDKCCEI